MPILIWISAAHAKRMCAYFKSIVISGSFSISVAYDRYPLAVKLHLADLEATYLREHGTSDVRH